MLIDGDMMNVMKVDSSKKEIFIILDDTNAEILRKILFRHDDVTDEERRLLSLIDDEIERIENGLV